MLLFNCVHSQRQRFLVLAHRNKTRSQIADKVHIERVVTLSVKLILGLLPACSASRTMAAENAAEVGELSVVFARRAVENLSGEL